MKTYPTKTEYYESFSRDFEGEQLPAVKIDKSYRYERKSFAFRFFRFLLYRCIATPAAFIYCKMILKDKIHGKEKVKSYKKGGFFIYGNHTRDVADAFLPSIALFPKRVHIVVSSKNLSIPFIGKCLPYLGAIPLPTEASAIKNFSKAVTSHALEGDALMIYPEAHLWPFMKDLRPFGSESFTYPIKTSLPVFCMTRTYKKHGHSYKSEIYIDGPFFPDSKLPMREARDKLCEEVRRAMKERCSESNIEIIKYVDKASSFYSELDEREEKEICKTQNQI